MDAETFQPTKTGVRVLLHVQPGASKSEIKGLHGDRLKVRLRAKPVEGAANAALVKFIASTTGVSKSAVELVRGETSRAKEVEITCADPADVERVLREAAGL